MKKKPPFGRTALTIIVISQLSFRYIILANKNDIAEQKNNCNYYDRIFHRDYFYLILKKCQPGE